jgi:hypothetical protein
MSRRGSVTTDLPRDLVQVKAIGDEEPHGHHESVLQKVHETGSDQRVEAFSRVVPIQTLEKAVHVQILDTSLSLYQRLQKI